MFAAVFCLDILVYFFIRAVHERFEFLGSRVLERS